jgi:uncharacterized membrane protein YjgN (DUF898 family)
LGESPDSDPGAAADTIGDTYRPQAATEHRFAFRGDWREYFRIWIVNLALSVLTLGIYSAWATVRSQRWFYGNTWVAGAPFEYLAQPLQILKGRAVAMLLLVVYLLVQQLVPVAAPGLILLLLLATPWLVVASLRFRARYSAWQSLSMEYTGELRDAWGPFVGLSILTLITGGIAYPYARQRQTAFAIRPRRFGDLPFGFDATVREFYGVYGRAAALVIGSFILLGLASAFAPWQLLPEAAQPSTSMAALGFVVAVYGGLLLGWVYVSSRLTNLTFNATRIGRHGLISTLRFRDLLKLYLVNTLAILASAGLLLPWAAVRMARYRADRTRLLARGELRAVRTTPGAAQGAAGSEAAQAFDVDLSL